MYVCMYIERNAGDEFALLTSYVWPARCYFLDLSENALTTYMQAPIIAMLLSPKELANQNTPGKGK